MEMSMDGKLSHLLLLILSLAFLLRSIQLRFDSTSGLDVITFSNIEEATLEILVLQLFISIHVPLFVHIRLEDPLSKMYPSWQESLQTDPGRMSHDPFFLPPLQVIPSLYLPSSDLFSLPPLKWSMIWRITFRTSDWNTLRYNSLSRPFTTTWQVTR